MELRTYIALCDIAAEQGTDAYSMVQDWWYNATSNAAIDELAEAEFGHFWGTSEIHEWLEYLEDVEG